MARFIVYFNQQWVGDHPEEWYRERGILARAVVEEMRAAGVLVVAGGLEEDLDRAVRIDPTGGAPVIASVALGREWLGGLTIMDVPDDESARAWGDRIAIACGWPQVVRPFTD